MNEPPPLRPGDAVDEFLAEFSRHCQLSAGQREELADHLHSDIESCMLAGH